MGAIPACKQFVRADVVRLAVIGIRHTLIGVSPVAHRSRLEITIAFAYRLGQEIALAVGVHERKGYVICSGIGALGV